MNLRVRNRQLLQLQPDSLAQCLCQAGLMALLVVSTLGMTGCAANRADVDPLGTLRSPSIIGSKHLRAMEALDASDPNGEETIKVLHQVVAKDFYAVDAREAALNRLAERDLEGLKRTIRQSLPRSESWPWITRCGEIIADHDWKDLSPALVSSWARPVTGIRDDLKRPEFKSLARMHGDQRMVEMVFEMFMQSKSVSEQFFRTRCWELLHRLGQRERLVQLLASSGMAEDDAMLIDLRRGATELGVVPRNREEILWLRKLCEPARDEFWVKAVEAVQDLSPARRAELELRDVPVLVAASRHEPELLEVSAAELYARIDAYLRTQPHYVQESNYDNIAGGSHQRLHESREKLTWGDLAAMQIAVRAMQAPEVRRHLFDYAERDKADTSTEYGGVIALDGKERFVIMEFQPVMRRHDQEFISSQAMLDAAYTSIFHFHMHAQNYRNDKYAGPGFGDLNYADNTRANCLVFTFMNKDTMNVDFYRHGRVVVDLGVIRR